MSALLSAKDISVRFGGVAALTEADLSVGQGTVTSLIGPNGAGKTTLLSVITGLLPQASGRVVLDGVDLTAMPPHRRAAAGIARTYQNLEIFSGMSTLENVITGAHMHCDYSPLDALFATPKRRRMERAVREEAMEILAFLELDGLAASQAVDLPYGKQRLVELARALASRPKLLLLDEPAAGLNNAETAILGQAIRKIRDQRGITVLLVEHDMDLVMSISDFISVLHFGSMLANGTPTEIQSNPEVISAYLGD